MYLYQVLFWHQLAILINSTPSLKPFINNANLIPLVLTTSNLWHPIASLMGGLEVGLHA